MRVPAYHVVGALRGLSLGLFSPLWVAYLYSRGMDLISIGLLGTLFEAVKFIFEVPTGALADHWGDRRSLLTGTALMVLTWVGFGFIQGFGLACVVMVTWAAGEAFMSGAYESWISGLVPEERLTRTFLDNSRINVIALVLGAAGSGWVYQRSPTLLFLVIAALFAVQLGVLLGARFAARSPELAHAPEKPSLGLRGMLAHTRASASDLLRWRLGGRVAIMTLFAAMVFDGIARFYQPALVDRGTSPQAMGGVTFAAALVVLVFLTLGARLTARIDRAPLAAVAAVDLAVVALCAAVVLLSGAPALMAIALLLAMEDVRDPILKSVIARGAPQARRATILSLVSGIGAAGEILAGVIFGLLVSTLGEGSVFVVGAALMLPTITAGLLRRAAGDEPSAAGLGSSPQEKG
ncbi:MFS transporter [Sorangium cellulosum]|uniref:MFS transporter n=1 Tax=Sorangium cellulosum TaxID=56 RepID=A0A4P2QC18_SORCE|nr:MFS transporter [Sorangium cellulosum]AUX27277.1 MFS transporter [Sorangium cellulosum]